MHRNSGYASGCLHFMPHDHGERPNSGRRCAFARELPQGDDLASDGGGQAVDPARSSTVATRAHPCREQQSGQWSARAAQVGAQFRSCRLSPRRLANRYGRSPVPRAATSVAIAICRGCHASIALPRCRHLRRSARAQAPPSISDISMRDRDHDRRSIPSTSTGNSLRVLLILCFTDQRHGRRCHCFSLTAIAATASIIHGETSPAVLDP